MKLKFGKFWYNYKAQIKMAFILGVTLQDLGHPKTDLDETLGIYRVHSETMQRHIFHFRSRPGNRKLEIFRKSDYNPM